MAKVRKAVITAAGRGTRQYPASTAVQKEMFPLVDRDGLTKPVIQIIGEEAIDSGIEEICIITQPGEEKPIANISAGSTTTWSRASAARTGRSSESEKLGASASACTSPNSTPRRLRPRRLPGEEIRRR